MPLFSGPRAVLVIWLAFFVAAAAILWLFSSILLPFVLGVAIAYLLDPLVDRCEQLGLGRSLATTLVLVVATLAAFAVTGLLLPVVSTGPPFGGQARPDQPGPWHGWTKFDSSDGASDGARGSAQEPGPLFTGEVGALARQARKTYFGPEQRSSRRRTAAGDPLVAWYMLRGRGRCW